MLRGDPLALPGDGLWVDARALHRGELPAAGVDDPALQDRVAAL